MGLYRKQRPRAGRRYIAVRFKTWAQQRPALSGGVNPGFQWSRDFKGNNCFNATNRRQYSTFEACTHGTSLYLTEPARLCANVQLSVGAGTTRGCGKTIKIIDQDEVNAGYCIDWRYITRDGNWVMVADTHRDIQRGGWGFIRRGAFAKGRTKDFTAGVNNGAWPGITERGTCNNPAATP